MTKPKVEIEYSGGQYRVKLTLPVGTLLSGWFYNVRLCEDIGTRVANLLQAENVWNELSKIVGCASPDGSAELEQVRYYQELLVKHKEIRS